MASKMKRSIVRRHRDRRSVHWASPSGRHGRDNGAAVLRTNCTGGLGGSRPTTAATNAKAEAPVAKAPFVDAYALRLDPSLGEGLDAQLLARDLWAPISRHEDGHYVVITAQEPTEQRRQAVQRVLEAPVELAVTTKSGVFHVLSQICRGQLLDQASSGLWRDDEERSARKVLSRPQALSLVAALLALGYGLGFALRATLVTTSAVIACGFLVCVLFKFVVCLVGAYHENLLEVTDEDVAALTDANLPIYTVLVPCYREANVVPQLMANLAVLDYPQDKLDILLLLEEDDDETRVAAMAAEPPATVTFITVPKGQPQTKPKACNVGLIFARGEYLVIYDAEDRPDPDQLKKAVAAFRKGGPDLVCVQAALNYFNDEENALTRMFTLEYSFWFDYMLTGLSALDLPIPLGGTSNHFRTEDLRSLGGWDPFNVTEDADLGIRAAMLGKRVAVIQSTTFEEANNSYPNFVRQRSRWVKGYLQTTLVNLRHPVRLVRSVGWKQALGFALLIAGTPVSFLALMPLYALLAVSLALPPTELASYFPGWVLWVSLANLLLGNALMVYVSMMGVFKRQRHHLALWALLNPAYWLLHSIAAYKALAQLIVRPHYWEKTVHGLTSVQPAAGPR
jgi:glycosyltransferase XagB